MSKSNPWVVFLKQKAGQGKSVKQLSVEYRRLRPECCKRKQGQRRPSSDASASSSSAKVPTRKSFTSVDEWLASKGYVRVGGSAGEAGRGAVARAVFVRRANTNLDAEPTHVLKVQSLGPNFSNEVRALTELQASGVVPKLYGHWRNPVTQKGFILMERLYDADWDEEKIPYGLYGEIVNPLLQAIRLWGWVQGDLNDGNLMYRRGKEGNSVVYTPVLVDFGMAAKEGEDANFEKMEKRQNSQVSQTKNINFNALGMEAARVANRAAGRALEVLRAAKKKAP